MGLSGSKYEHSSNDYEMAIKISKELEYVLERHFHGNGLGLHTKITNASAEIPSPLKNKMRKLATIRNQLIHERGFDNIPDRKRFIAQFEEADKELDGIVQSRECNSTNSYCSIQ
jgi:hypothetical protein